MTVESVRDFFSRNAPDIQIIELDQSTATVELAAQAHGVAPGQIAKTLCVQTGSGVVLIVASGDTRLDNKKMKQVFGGRTKMLPADDVLAVTGHPVGGVCPFGLAHPLPVYCDTGLKGYEVVLPAAGSTASTLRITPRRLAELAGAQWVDVCRG